MFIWTLGPRTNGPHEPMGPGRMGPGPTRPGNDPRPLLNGGDCEGGEMAWDVELGRWGVFFYWSDWGLSVAWGLMFVTWCVCAPCALWCLRTPARGDGGFVAPA